MDDQQCLVLTWIYSETSKIRNCVKKFETPLLHQPRLTALRKLCVRTCDLKLNCEHWLNWPNLIQDFAIWILWSSSWLILAATEISSSGERHSSLNLIHWKFTLLPGRGPVNNNNKKDLKCLYGALIRSKTLLID